MSSFAANEKALDKFGPFTLIIGILLIVLGVVGVVLPGVMSLGTVVFVAWLLLTGGILWVVHTYKHSPTYLMHWLKPILLLVTGGLMLFYPLSGVAAVGLLLAIYLLLDAYGSFALAQMIRPARGWGWMSVNGVLSLLMALLFLIGWPSTSLWLVGLYVGISLVFNGLALAVIGWTLRKGASA
jgi:uncharacterized membrane protein HdeD (DUF308 family)